MNIFISYRRNPCVEFARTIHFALSKYGIDSFFDYTSCRDGRFNENIFRAIEECDYVFLILMDGALNNITNTDDWVRTELEYAIDKGKPIIPIVQNGHKRAWPEKMPEKLEQLRFLQISKIDNEELFETSLLEVLKNRTKFRYEEDKYKSDNSKKKETKVSLQQGFIYGFDLLAVVMKYLRKQVSDDEVMMMQYTLVPGISLNFPPISILSANNMLEYLDICARTVKPYGVEKIEESVAFGALFHLSDIARRSNLGSSVAHSYDEAFIEAGKRIGLPEKYLNQIAEYEGPDMMQFYENIKSIIG